MRYKITMKMWANLHVICWGRVVRRRGHELANDEPMIKKEPRISLGF